MKSGIPFYYHVILFSIFYLLTIVWQMAINQSVGILSFNLWSLLFSASLLLSVFLAYLIHFYTFCHWFLNKKYIVLHVITIPLILILFACIRYLLEEVLIYQFTGIHNYVEKTRIVTFYLRDNFFYGLPAVILSSIVFLFWEFQTYQKQNQILQLENKKAEFQLLKSQISPHFLFNTLNSFYSDWVEKDPETAEDLLKLSDLLRYIIMESDKESVLLKNEIRFIENYIHLQRKRFENQLFLEFSIDGNYLNEMVLPSVLIHFVENVFKHGILNQLEKTAVIKIKVENDFLEIFTFNSIQSGENYTPTGIGFENLTRRLTYNYKESFLLHKEEKNNIFTTYLKIPLKTDL